MRSVSGRQRAGSFEQTAPNAPRGLRCEVGCCGDRPTPSNAYLRAARDLGQRQAAIGGYRLADLLTGLLGG